MEEKIKTKPAGWDDEIDMGFNIKVARQANGKVQKQIADAVGLSEYQVMNLEKKPYIEDRELVKKIADAIGCTVDFIEKSRLRRQTRSNTNNIETNNPTVHCAEGSSDIVTQNQGVIGDQYITNNMSLDYIKELHQDLLSIKDKAIGEKDKEINKREREIKYLKEQLEKVLAQ